MNIRRTDNNNKSEKIIKIPDKKDLPEECPKKEKDCANCTTLNCPEEDS